MRVENSRKDLSWGEELKGKEEMYGGGLVGGIG